ncbi:hypothetical protein FMJ25_27125 [Klebsiella grimontii]|nr:hypothetical protein [Klebsiella grimontii]
MGCSTGGSDQTLVRKAYTLNNNSRSKFANWVAYKITKTSLASGCSRSWKRDPDLPATDTLAPAAYKGASAALAVDRGHQATPKSASFYDYQVTVEEIERRTHPALSFWSALPAGIARRLKSRKGALAKEMGCP